MGKSFNPSQSQVPFMVEGGQKLHGFVLWRKWSTLGETSNQFAIQSGTQEVLLSFIFPFSLYFLV